ncbi:Smr/MutS family protein [Candidatus Pelagibacter sp.]|uniref:Smr/MutS family protein n=1 Tax=Candidatus Pelagibacter sp. TaxID=2024849 RepID=UPI003F85B2FF
MNSKISEKDKKTWEEFLSNDQKLPDKDNFQSKIKSKKIRSLDLHGKSLDEANQIIENFIRKSYEDKVHKLIIVTGKGLHSSNEKDPYVSKDLGILKYSIPNFLKNNAELMGLISNISEASIEDGGSGAFYIFLKKK